LPGHVLRHTDVDGQQRADSIGARRRRAHVSRTFRGGSTRR
jgi:hypothetical protein